MIETWSAEQRESFDRHGFVVVEEGFVDDATVEVLRERFEPLFAGSYETGIRPDEVNWVPAATPRTGRGRSATAGRPTRRSRSRCSRSGPAGSPPS